MSIRFLLEFKRKYLVARPPYLRRLALGTGSIAGFGLAAALALAVAQAAAAVLLGLIAGVLSRLLIQWANILRVRRGDSSARFATFVFADGHLQVRFDSSAVNRFVSDWKWRAGGGFVSATVCFCTQRIEWLGLGWRLAGPSWLASIIEKVALSLPFVLGGLLLWWKGPLRWWRRQAEAAVKVRTAASWANLGRRRELEGLAAGVTALWEAVGERRPDVYRQAVESQVRLHAAEAALHPEMTLSYIETITELARQDLVLLGHAFGAYRPVECRLEAARVLAEAIRAPRLEMQADELRSRLMLLLQMAAERRWEDFSRQTMLIDGDVEALLDQLHEPSRVGPVYVLAAGTDPYRLLGISRDTPTPLVRKLRLRLAQLYHPDVNTVTPNSTKMAELNAAFDAVMKDRAR